MSSILLVNGRFVPEAEATVSASDAGLLHGAGLFETMRADHGKVFRYQQHIDRLLGSVELMLRPVDPAELPTQAQVEELIKRNHLSTARIRMTVTAGPMRSDLRGAAGADRGRNGTNSNEPDLPPLTSIVSASALTPYPDDMYRHGVAVMICPFRTSTRDATAGHKTTAYLPRLIGLRRAQEKRCLEAIWFTTENRLAEGSISNVFLVSNGVLRTPPLDTPVLPGVTRGAIFDVASELNIDHREEPLTIEDLLDADEVLLTNTTMHVMPVVRVEKHDIADGKPGPMAAMLHEHLLKLIDKECQA